MLTRRDQLHPIDTEQTRRLRLIGDRLASILRVILNEPPFRGKPLRELAATLGLDFSTCQRINRAASSPEPLRAIVELPGVQALESFVAALAKHETSAANRKQASRAIAEYAEAIKSFGGSHAKLKRRIALAASIASDGAAAVAPAALGERAGSTHDADIRREIFTLATKLLRARLRGFVSINALGPLASNSRQSEIGTVSASLGYTAAPGGHPLIAANFRGVNNQPLPTTAQLGRLTAGSSTLVSGTSVLDDFCSTPSPSITSVGRFGRMLHVVDIAPNAGPVDIVTASRAQPSESPLIKAPKHDTFYVKVRQPNARIILDIYLHRSFAATAIASSGVLQTDPSLLNLRSVEPVNAWEDRLPTSHNLQQLGLGMSNAGSDLWPRHAEAARELFTRLGWNADEFALYRLDVAFPLWNAFYYIDFDFREPDVVPTVTDPASH